MPKILIADDQPLARTILKDMLSKGGYSEVIEADNGDDAVDLYSKERPDLVLMDLVMPGSGVNAISNILAENPRAKIIIVSAIGAEDKIRQALDMGAMDYIKKPLTESKVLETVRKALGGAASPP